MDDEKHTSTPAQQDQELNWPQSQLEQISKLHLVSQFISFVRQELENRKGARKFRLYKGRKIP